MRGFTRCAGLAALVAASVGASPARAQTPAPLDLDKPLSEKPVDKLPDNATTLAAALGGSLNTGNTKAWQLSAGGNFLLVRNPHALSAAVDFAYGQANIPTDTQDNFIDTVKNLRAKLRYDYFLTQLDAVFVASGFRRDQFAGIDARVQGQLGYARYFYRAATQRFWGEVGYDLTYDDFSPLPPDNIDGTQVVHSARVFIGYDNHLNETVTYLGGIEGLFDVKQAKDVRVNFDNALRSTIVGHLQLELKFSLQFDNVPAPGAEKLDTQTIVSFIYSLI